MIKKKDFLGSLDTNPYPFHHYDLSYFAMYVNGKQIPSEGLYSYNISRIHKIEKLICEKIYYPNI